MSTQDRLGTTDNFSAVLSKGGLFEDLLKTVGEFTVECRGPDGKLKWSDTIKNTVVTVGKNALLDNSLEGSAYTVTGPFMGLISSTSYSGINATDTMSAHAGWREAGNANTPTYSANRKTCVWSAASGGVKALSAGLVFTFTGGGTVKGAFICYGAGAVNTIDSTAGTLFAAGLFSGGDKTVGVSDTLTISYSVTLT